MTLLPEEPRYRPWINIHPLKVSVCIPHKNGTTSFGKAVTKLFPETRGRRWKTALHTSEMELTFEPIYDAYFVVREPVERFCSLWKNKCRDHRTPYLRLGGLTKEELMDVIESGKVDGHFMKQSTFLGQVDATIVDIEAFAFMWEEWTGNRFPHEYGTEGETDVSEALLCRLCLWYADDFELWRKRWK